jgi:GWxTD domain-containing protein
MRSESGLSSKRPPTGAERGPSGPLFFALIAFLLATLPSFAADPILKWIHSQEAYFATNEELDLWKRQVVSPADAQKFIEQYWRTRGESFRKEVHSRIEFADSKFSLAKVPGSLTAMGRTWMILGSPNEQQSSRGTSGAAMEGSPLTGRMQDSPLERGAKVTYRWTYKKDRLPPELGRPELVVEFNTDVSRGSQFIENPGQVEPFLRRAAALLSSKAASTAGTSSASPRGGSPAAQPAVSAPDALWGATPAANSVILTGESFISPTDRPFHAVSFFIPKEATPFTQWNSALLVSLIRDATGVQIFGDRRQVDLKAYDGAGNRYVDQSYELAPGKYDAAFALYSPEGTTMLANWRQQFEVYPAVQSRVSPLLVTSRIDVLENQTAFDPFTFVATKYAVRGDRKFLVSDKISFFTVVQSPAGDTPKLMQKMTITKNGQPFFKSPLEDANLTQTGPKSYLVGITFDPATFKAGHYAVELQLRDMNAPEGTDPRTKGSVVSAEFDVMQ